MNYLLVKIKQFGPKTLYGRFVLMLLMPLLLVQIVLIYYFIDRHTDTILEGLAASIAGDIRMIIEMIEQGSDLDHIKQLASQNLNLEINYTPNKQLSELGQHKDTWLYSYMGEALDAKLKDPYFVHMSQDHIYVDVQISPNKTIQAGTLQFVTLRKRLFARTTGLVLILSISASIVFFFVSFLFLRNQMRPLRRLAHVAEEFGKGKDLNFYPEGAIEVRKVGLAFLIMRHRIQRLLSERLEMLAGISHDLRTPISRLKLQMALMRESSPPSKDELTDIKEDIKQMEEIVESFLSFSNAAVCETSHKQNINDLIHDAINQISKSHLLIHFDDIHEAVCDVKPFLVKRCLLNIMANSKKYAKTLWIKTQVSDNYVEIILQDDGPGIPKSERENVFKPFYRLDEARNLDSGGIGLGLSIVRDIMRNHGGTVEIGDSDKGGLMVRLSFPR